MTNAALDARLTNGRSLKSQRNDRRQIKNQRQLESESMTSTIPPLSSLPIARPRRVGRSIIVVVLFVVGGLVAYSLVTNPRFGWPIVAEWFFSERILAGLGNTLMLTVISMVIGIVLGGVLGIMTLSTNKIILGAAGMYIWFFRGTPVFVQLLFWGSISALYPVISLGIPFGPQWFEFSANSVITPLGAAILGLGLNEGAYMAEIVRASIKSVDSGQREAAGALGMSRFLTLWRVVLPQAMPILIPPTGNQVIGMLKTSSLVAVLAFPELLYSAQLIYAVNYQTIPLLITASLWYLLVTTVLTIGQYFLEKYYGRSLAALQPRKRPSTSAMKGIA